MYRPTGRGFTLIELLIVVAIIAILAAIAIPNFIEAQTRSKVSRVKADMRSLATAVEAYRVDNNRYPLTRAFVGEVAGALIGKLPIQVEAPTCVDVVLHRKGSRRLIHLINRASGVPNRPNDGTIDEIPQVGPIEISIQLEKKPKKVRLAFEKGHLKWKYKAGKKGGKLTAHVDRVHIHAALVVE